MSGPTTLLGFDVGARRIGVAVGNTVSLSAREVGVLDVHEGGPDWPRLDRWIREWHPDALVVGDPATLDGGDQPITSSIEAAQRFAAGRAAGARRRREAAQLDALAAVVILERWLAEPDSRLPLADTSP